jgi:hypothetical protein
MAGLKLIVLNELCQRKLEMADNFILPDKKICEWRKEEKECRHVVERALFGRQ